MIRACVLCFCAGIFEAIASALNTLFITNGQTAWMFVNSYLLVVVWVYVVRTVARLVNAITITLVYATGYAIGNFIALYLHKLI